MNFVNLSLNNVTKHKPFQSTFVVVNTAVMVTCQYELTFSKISNNNAINMYTQKCIGVWMDEFSAHLIEFAKLRVETVIVRAKIKEKERFLQAREDFIDDHNLQENFFKKIAEPLSSYETILLFGPNEEKISFEKYLKSSTVFEEKNIAIQTADKMTDNHKHAFVNKYFKTLSPQKL